MQKIKIYFSILLLIISFGMNAQNFDAFEQSNTQQEVFKNEANLYEQQSIIDLRSFDNSIQRVPTDTYRYCPICGEQTLNSNGVCENPDCDYNEGQPAISGEMPIGNGIFLLLIFAAFYMLFYYRFHKKERVN